MGSAIIAHCLHLRHLTRPMSSDAPPSSPNDIQRQLTYLQAIVSSMPQGISVFDEDLRLRVWNLGFLNVLNLPDEAVYEGVPFADLIRIPATRGEYGPGDIEMHVARMTALARKFDRTVYGVDAAPGSGFDTLGSAPALTV